MSNTRAYRSKIGQLPFAFRNELNNRIRDGRTGSELLTHINTSKEFKALKRRTRSKPVNPQNLSDWRDSGYKDWLIDQDRTKHIREITEFSRSLVSQAGGKLASAGCDIIAGKILEGLSTVDEPTDELVKALVSLKKEETSARKLKLAQSQLALKEREFNLDRKRYQRSTCELFLKWFKNKAVSKIISSKSTNNDAKTEALGRHLFGEYWDDAPATAPKRKRSKG